MFKVQGLIKMKLKLKDLFANGLEFKVVLYISPLFFKSWIL